MTKLRFVVLAPLFSKSYNTEKIWWALGDKIRTFLFDINNILEVAEFDRRMRYYLNEKGK